eukprot:jgi/Chrzof1/14287/Cz08g31390.t1
MLTSLTTKKFAAWIVQCVVLHLIRNSLLCWLRASCPCGWWKLIKRKTWLLRVTGLAVLFIAVLVTFLTIGRRETLTDLLLWIHTHQVAGFVLFGLLYVWFTVLFLPPAVLAVCAGAMFGLWVGVLFVWVSATIGESIEFLLGRFLLRKWVRELTANWSVWQALQAALQEDGWKLVILLRISPVMPFSVINYALGTSSLPFSHYFWPSVFGIIPGILLYVYLGTLAVDITQVISDKGMSSAPATAKVVFIVLSAATALLAIVLSAVYTKRAIDRRLAHVQMSEHADAEQQPCPCEGQHPATAYEDHPVLIIEDDVQRQRQHHMQYNAKAKAQSAEAYRQAHHALRTEDQGTKQESRLSGRSHDDTAWLNCVASYCCILSVLCCISSAVAAAGIYQQSCTVRDMQSDKRLFLLNRPIKPVLE